MSDTLAGVLDLTTDPAAELTHLFDTLVRTR